MIAPRKTLRRNEPTQQEKQEARQLACDRTEGMCEYFLRDGGTILGETIECSPKCLRGPLPLEGDIFQRGHLCHVKSKRRFGWHESNTNAHLYGCYWCHAWEHSGGKPVPKK